MFGDLFLLDVIIYICKKHHLINLLSTVDTGSNWLLLHTHTRTMTLVIVLSTSCGENKKHWKKKRRPTLLLMSTFGRTKENTNKRNRTLCKHLSHALLLLLYTTSNKLPLHTASVLHLFNYYVCTNYSWFGSQMPKLCNQVRSLDHFVVQNSGDFLWWIYKEVVCFYV